MSLYAKAYRTVRPIYARLLSVPVLGTSLRGIVKTVRLVKGSTQRARIGRLEEKLDLLTNSVAGLAERLRPQAAILDEKLNALTAALDGVQHRLSSAEQEVSKLWGRGDQINDRAVRLTETCNLANGRWGKFLTLCNDTTIGATLAQQGIWGEQDVKVFERVVRPGMTVADVGANIGHHSVVLSKLCGPKGFVLSIEPQYVIYQLLNANLILNGCRNARAVQCALGATPGTARMFPISYDSECNFGALGVNMSSASELKGRGEEVPVETLDRLSERILGDRKFDFIKVDVQTYELFVLQGAGKLMNNNHPIMYIEVSPYWMQQTGYDYRDIYRFLFDHQYRIEHPTNEAPIDQIPDWDGHSEHEWNILALPR